MRRLVLVLAVGALTTLAPVSASAALLWTLVASPLTAVAYQSATFTFTASNLDLVGVLGCLEVDLPGSFVIEAIGTPTASNGATWAASATGNAVVVHSIDNAGRLKLANSVTFTVRAQPTVAGSFSLANHSHVRFDCGGIDQPGVALPITVLPGATPTPVPTPTPRPTPRPTPKPTPTPLPVPTLPLPSLPLPTVLPTAPPPQATPTPRPTAGSLVGASPSGSALASSSPRPSGLATPSASADPVAPGPGPAGGGPPASGAGAPQVRLEPADLKLNAQLFDLLGSPQVWFVPAAAIGAPGLLVLLWVLLQTVGTLAWIPFVRRMRGQEAERRGRSRRIAVR
jgi:hypothetical protein